MRATFMAVAHNGEVLRKEEHAGVTIRDGDVLIKNVCARTGLIGHRCFGAVGRRLHAEAVQRGGRIHLRKPRAR